MFMQSLLFSGFLELFPHLLSQYKFINFLLFLLFKGAKSGAKQINLHLLSYPSDDSLRTSSLASSNPKCV